MFENLNNVRTPRPVRPRDSPGTTPRREIFPGTEIVNGASGPGTFTSEGTFSTSEDEQDPHNLGEHHKCHGGVHGDGAGVQSKGELVMISASPRLGALLAGGAAMVAFGITGAAMAAPGANG